MELLLRVDAKGRILIPASIRRELGLERVVRARVEGGRLVIEPVGDPVEALTRAVVEGTRDVEEEVARLGRVVGEEAVRRVVERWS